VSREGSDAALDSVALLNCIFLARFVVAVGTALLV